MGYGNEKRLNDKLPVVISNKIIEARYKLSLEEQKLVLTLASKIKDSDTDFLDFEVSAKEFSNLLGLKGTDYKSLKNAGRKLLDRKIEIETERDYIGFHWFSKVHYQKNKGKLILRLHEDLRPFFLYLFCNQEYTKFYLENVLHFSSTYTIRIYELLKQYEKIGSRTIKLEELRNMLYIEPEEYKLYGDFKRRIIDTAQKEINEKSDIRIAFEELKDARKVTAIKFYIKASIRNTVNSKFNSLDALPKEQLIRLLQLEIQNRYVVRINYATIESHTQGAILKLLKDLRQGNYDKTNIRSPEGFFKWQLEELEMSYQFNE